MATSAFKSSSKRPTTSSSSSSTTTNNKQQSKKNNQNSTLRRSRSVSAFSRGTHLDKTSEFQNKTDNPLFSVDGSPNSEEGFDGVRLLSKFDAPNVVKGNALKGCADFGGESRRGRSISRNSNGNARFSGGSGNGGGEVRKTFGRSLSRVDTGRRRRSPSSVNSESEREQENGSSNLRSKSKISSNSNRSMHEGKNKLARSASDLSEILKGRNTWTSQHPVYETSDDTTSSLFGSQIPCWDDKISTSYFSEAEERTIKPVSEEIKIIPFNDNTGTTGGIIETVRSEVRQAISDMQNDFNYAMQRSNSDVIHSSSFISDVDEEPEILNTVELVQDFREEFERELEECEERRRKLQAELAVEEHRESELTNILNDIVPEPKTPLVQKPRAARKASYERKKISKQLEEEALAYFDECVSISTFDDSEFSSLDDLHSMFCVDGPSSERVGLSLSVIPSVASSLQSQDDTQRNSVVQCAEASKSAFSDSHSSSKTKSQFSFTPKPSDTVTLEEDIRNYVKSFCKDSGLERSSSHIVSASRQNTEDYNCEVPMEKLLLDRVTFRSRIESGSMLLCGGGFSLSPFSSVSW